MKKIVYLIALCIFCLPTLSENSEKISNEMTNQKESTIACSREKKNQGKKSDAETSMRMDHSTDNGTLA